MVTPDMCETLACLLEEWCDSLLRGQQRLLFLTWLRDHTQKEFSRSSFRLDLIDWLSRFASLRDLFSEVLLLQTEIVWTSNAHRAQKVDHEIKE